MKSSRPEMHRLVVLMHFIFLTLCAHAQTSAQLWTAYAAAPNTHPQIANYSYAGYMRGELPIPTVPVVATVTDAAYGASATPGFDNTAAVQAALDYAGSIGGGAVLIPAGTYEFQGMLFITHSGVVLRGAGKGTTVFDFKNDLNNIFRIVGYSGSPYSWTGGHIWIAPNDLFRRDDRKAINYTTENALNNDPHTWEWAQPGEILTTISGEAARGGFDITVADVSRLKSGDFIYLTWQQSTDDSFLKELTEFANWQFNTQTDWQNTFTSTQPGDFYSDRWITPPRFNWYQWPVEIAAVTGNTVTLRQPLRVRITDGTSGPDRNVTVRAQGEMLSGVGVENLTIKGHNVADLNQPDWQIGFTNGWNGVYMQRNFNSWIHNIETVDCHLSVIVDASKNVTVSGLDARNPTNRAVHNVIDVKLESADCLMENINFIVDAGTASQYYGHGGMETEYFSSGLVFGNNVFGWGTYDYHRAIPFDILHTNEVMNSNSGEPGGNGRAGPMAGRRWVHWNVASSGGAWVNMPKQIASGALVGMRGPVDNTFYMQRGVIDGDKGAVIADAGLVPAITDLYQAQLDLRLSGATNASVAVLQPADESIIESNTAGVNVLVKGAAFGANSVSQIRLYVDGTLGTSTSATTLTHTLSGLSPGRHELYAELTTGTGQVVTGNRTHFHYGVNWSLIDNTNPAITYTGMVAEGATTMAYYETAYTYTSGDAVGNSYHRTNNYGAPSGTMTVPFTGIRAKVLIPTVRATGYKVYAQAHYKIYLDNMVTPVEEGILLNEGTYRHRVVLFDTGYILPGAHTLKVEFSAPITEDRGHLFVDAVEVLSPDTASGYNAAPTISDVANQSMLLGNPSVGPINLSVGDDMTAPGSLVVTRASSNPTLLPLSGITLGGSGANRTVTLAPAAGQSGVSTVTLTVTDGSGSTGSDSFTFTVTAPPVATAIVVTPANSTVFLNATKQFSAVLNDQYGQPIVPQPAFVWTVTGGGVIDTSGLFTAGSSAGSFSVSAAASSLTGSASVTVASSGANLYWASSTQDWNSGTWRTLDSATLGTTATWANGDNAFITGVQGGVIRLNGTAIIANHVMITKAGEQIRLQHAAASLTVNGTYSDLSNTTYTPNTNTGAKTFTFNSDLANTMNASILNGSGTIGFTKGGAGAVTLTNATSSYAGPTSVTQGSLIVKGNISTSSGIAVSNGAALGGESADSGVTTGKVSAITLNGGAGTGGILAPGDGAAGDLGVLYGTSLVWNGSNTAAFSQMKCDLAANSAAGDQLVLSGAMSKGTGSFFRFDFGGTGDPTTARTYTLVTATGGFGTFAAGDFSYTGLAVGLSGSFAISGNLLQFTTVVAPVSSGYDNWKSSSFPVGIPAPQTAPTFDYDGDGLVNLLEYALGSDPATASTAPPAQIVVIEGNEYFQIQWTRPNDRTDITTVGEVSATLADWSSAIGEVSTTITPAGVGLETVTIRAVHPVGHDSSRFLHARIILNAP